MLYRVVRMAVRRSTMTVLAEIVCSVSQGETTQAAVKVFCKETGSPSIKRLTSCFPNRWAELLETGRHIFLIASMWPLMGQKLLVQLIS